MDGWFSELMSLSGLSPRLRLQQLVQSVADLAARESRGADEPNPHNSISKTQLDLATHPASYQLNCRSHRSPASAPLPTTSNPPTLPAPPA